MDVRLAGPTTIVATTERGDQYTVEIDPATLRPVRLVDACEVDGRAYPGSRPGLLEAKLPAFAAQLPCPVGEERFSDDPGTNSFYLTFRADEDCVRSFLELIGLSAPDLTSPPCFGGYELQQFGWQPPTAGYTVHDGVVAGRSRLNVVVDWQTARPTVYLCASRLHR
jgi:hypothetical protein